MSTADRGGPAFPALQFIVPNDLEARHVARLGETQGMSLRDYFAGQVLMGLVSAETNATLAKARSTVADKMGQPIEALMARECYEIADAMIAAREKTV